MGMPSSGPRLPPLAIKIGLLVAALVVVTLAVVAGRSSGGDAEIERAAQSQAEVMRGAMGQATLARAVTQRNPSRAQRARVNRLLGRVAAESEALAVRLVSPSGRVAYSSVSGERGGKLPATPDFRMAMTGDPAAERQQRRGHHLGGRLRAAAPLRRLGAGRAS